MFSVVYVNRTGHVKGEYYAAGISKRGAHWLCLLPTPSLTTVSAVPEPVFVNILKGLSHEIDFKNVV